MNCVKCGNLIPEARIKALPETKCCVQCSEAGRVAGFPIITGKTTYSELEIVDQKTAEELYKKQERKGKVGGVKFDSPDNTKANDGF